jgi:hypothetical protein
MKVLQQLEFSYLTNQAFRSGYSNQRSMIIFIAKTDISKRKDPLLEVFNDETIPELADFLGLGLPLRQIVKVDRAFNAKETAATFKNKGASMSNQYDQFEIDTYPKMETFGASELPPIIEKLVNKKTADVGADGDD